MSLSYMINQLGGEMIAPQSVITQKLERIEAFVFDWDGVFNDGIKGENAPGYFSEASAMGLNMLRYGFWLTRHQLPKVAIITGQYNPTAFHFAEREHLHQVYRKFPHKLPALNHFCNTHHLKPEQVAFIYDDILDLSVARVSGLRCCVRNPAAFLFGDYVRREKVADYYTAHTGGQHAVREICELLIGLMNCYDEVVHSRTLYDEEYFRYWHERNRVETEFFRGKDGKVIADQPS
jgi:3-deoxy-D-manno-octulosonate 8-phosphate phosphatase (KDO 8-P phosphatase)